MYQLPEPTLQVDFSTALNHIRALCLQDALANTVSTLDVASIDKELQLFVPASSMSALAAHGLRAELAFPVPIVLTANPRLLGYYRLLYGYSQKQFYDNVPGVGLFKRMEAAGELSTRAAARIEDLCSSMSKAGHLLITSIGSNGISRSLLHDLTLLTLGAQLRGGTNVLIGAKAIMNVFEAITDIVQQYAINISSNSIVVTNAAGRNVLIQLAADPDITIREEMSPTDLRHLIAIEVKGGSDFSNIHNRIGEAEKSHQKARGFGYVECWTVVNVDRININMAQLESPSTNRFYRISDIQSKAGSEYEDFRRRIISLTGIPN